MEGTLDTLVTIYADKFYTYEENVLTALRELRQRQAGKQAAFEELVPEVYMCNSQDKSTVHLQCRNSKTYSLHVMEASVMHLHHLHVLLMKIHVTAFQWS